MRSPFCRGEDLPYARVFRDDENRQDLGKGLKRSPVVVREKFDGESFSAEQGFPLQDFHPDEASCPLLEDTR